MERREFLRTASGLLVPASALAQTTFTGRVTITGGAGIQPNPGGGGGATQWSMGYHGFEFIDDLQYTGLTHIAHFAGSVQANGTITMTSIEGKSLDLISTAHANNVQVLLCLDQAVDGRFTDAIEDDLSGFVANIVAEVNADRDPGGGTVEYDGVDIDWEPFDGSGASGTNMANFLAALRAALPTKLITVAAQKAAYAYWGTHYSNLDMINVMNYDSQWLGNGILWHNNPLYNTSHPSVNAMEADIGLFLAAGVPASKLGCGIAFYGRRHDGGTNGANGISDPYTTWSVAPTGGAETDYATVLDLANDAGVTDNYNTTHKGAYLSHPGNPANAWMVSYTSPQQIADIIAWARAQNLGGWIIFWLLADFVDGGSPEHPLLDAVHTAMQ